MQQQGTAGSVIWEPFREQIVKESPARLCYRAEFETRQQAQAALPKRNKSVQIRLADGRTTTEKCLNVRVRRKGPGRYAAEFLVEPKGLSPVMTAEEVAPLLKQDWYWIYK